LPPDRTVAHVRRPAGADRRKREAVNRALDHAIRLATDHDATIHALYVVDRRIATASSGELHDEVVADLESQGEDAVAAVAADRAAEAGVDVETHVIEGTPDTGSLTTPTSTGST